jgi:NADH-quinone oxidoreductase subunit A
MSIESAWLSVGGFLIVALLVGLGMVGAGRALRVVARRTSRLKSRPYECGEEPQGTFLQFHPGYYLVALVFVLFDVEALFLLPWSVVLRELGPAGFATAAFFVGVLTLGWLYAVRKEALRWQ